MCKCSSSNLVKDTCLSLNSICGALCEVVTERKSSNMGQSCKAVGSGGSS